jgi:hypothetical protein
MSGMSSHSSARNGGKENHPPPASAALKRRAKRLYNFVFGNFLFDSYEKKENPLYTQVSGG